MDLTANVLSFAITRVKFGNTYDMKEHNDE